LQELGPLSSFNRRWSELVAAVSTMLDYFAIFTKGGALLWTLQFTTALKHNPLDALNALIRTCLLEERSGDAAFTYAPKVGAQQALKWTFHNVSQLHHMVQDSGRQG
jgi:hypothetical protein